MKNTPSRPFQKKGLRLAVAVFSLFFVHQLVYPKSMVKDPLSIPQVKKAFDRFLTKESSFLQRGFDNAPLYVPIVEEVLERERMPRDLMYLPLIESAFSVHAHSRAGASGLWQFMPGTARLYALRIDYWVDERKDPFKSTEKAVRHLSWLFDRYGNWELALSAYNAGSGAVDSAMKKGKTGSYWDLCNMGLLKRETREYVPRFYAAAHIAKNPERYGFTYNRKTRLPEYEILNTGKVIDLEVLGEKSGVELSTLLALNPELKTFMTPFGERYELRVPKERFTEIIAVYLALPKNELRGIMKHRVRTGETLGEIAQKYDVDIHLLKRLNQISSSRRLYAGKQILIPVRSNSTGSNEDPLVPKKGFKTQEISYTVKKGDTLWDIAAKYQTSVEILIVINGLNFDAIIKPGDRIKLWFETALQR